MRIAAVLSLTLIAAVPEPASAADPGFVATCLRQESGLVAAPCRSLRAAFAFLRRDHMPPVEEAALIAAAVAAAEAVAARRPVAPDSELAEAALAGLLAAADPDAEHVRTDDAWPSAVAGTPGLTVTVRDGRALVVAVTDGGPAQAAGLRPGDVIVAVDGAALRVASRVEAERRLNGPPGSTVTLHLWRGGAGREVRLRREPERLPPPSAVSVDGARLIRIAAFGPDSLQAVRAALSAAPLPDAWILDLRGTARGPTDQALAVADLFVAGGVLATLRRRDGDPERLMAGRHEQAGARPLAVLIDAGTAGAAEVLAAALQDSGRAVTVGQPSFGAARDYRMLPLPDGGGIRIATGAWVRPSGTMLTRVEPDVAAEGDALPAALAALR